MIKIKPLVVTMMERSLPEFRFFGSPQVFYVFRRKGQRGLFEYVKYQRDGNTGALAVDIAITYDPNWDLRTTGTLGFDCPLKIYKQRGSLETSGLAYYAAEPWYSFGNDRSKLQAILENISNDLIEYGLAFFREAALILESDPLLQYGLDLVRKWGLLPNNQLITFQSEIEVANHRSYNIENLQFIRLEQQLRAYASDINVAKEQRRYISTLATQLLLLQADMQT